MKSCARDHYQHRRFTQRIAYFNVSCTVNNTKTVEEAERVAEE